MAAALKPVETETEEPEQRPLPAETPTIPGTMREWRTATGVKLGATGRMEGGGWWSRSRIDGRYLLHRTRADASLALTLAYMRGSR